MAYKPEAPPNKEILAKTRDSSKALSPPKNTGYTGYKRLQVAVVDQIIEDRIIAVLIDSEVFGASIWFALDDGWTPDPGDTTPVFYASELPFLRTKSPDTLREIFKVKLTFGGGMVRQ
ncbi:MAG: hypothetical protein Q8S00_04800 [Deltaproteobacteria bacterium]|nr:hypothetical protein [Deltaproteobacteria bacterium]